MQGALSRPEWREKLKKFELSFELQQLRVLCSLGQARALAERPFAGLRAWVTLPGGGVAGSAVTLRLTTKFKGRAVCIATLAYGIAVVLYGATPWLAWGLFAVALCGGTDAVGVTLRKSVVLRTKPGQVWR